MKAFFNYCVVLFSDNNRDYNEVLKELANQQIEFDLDDGVTINYAKFEGAVAKV